MLQALLPALSRSLPAISELDVHKGREAACGRGGAPQLLRGDEGWALFAGGLRQGVWDPQLPHQKARARGVRASASRAPECLAGSARWPARFAIIALRLCWRAHRFRAAPCAPRTSAEEGMPGAFERLSRPCMRGSRRGTLIRVGSVKRSWDRVLHACLLVCVHKTFVAQHTVTGVDDHRGKLEGRRRGDRHEVIHGPDVLPARMPSQCRHLQTRSAAKPCHAKPCRCAKALRYP